MLFVFKIYIQNFGEILFILMDQDMWKFKEKMPCCSLPLCTTGCFTMNDKKKVFGYSSGYEALLDLKHVKIDGILGHEDNKFH
jgi:hypothetical protein